MSGKTAVRAAAVAAAVGCLAFQAEAQAAGSDGPASAPSSMQSPETLNPAQSYAALVAVMVQRCPVETETKVRRFRNGEFSAAALIEHIRDCTEPQLAKFVSATAKHYAPIRGTVPAPCAAALTDLEVDVRVHFEEYLGADDEAPLALVRRVKAEAAALKRSATRAGVICGM